MPGWQGFFFMISMRNYKNENSGVNGFDLGPDFIILRFGSYYYLYSNKSTGADKVKHMKV